MIINDINYLEATNEEVFGGYAKTFNADINVDFDFDSDIDLTAMKDVDVDVKANVDISGNSGFLLGEVTSLGADTTSEINFAILTAPGVSEVTVSAYGATA